MDSHSIVLILTLFLVFVSAIVGGIAAKWLRFPTLVGYIAVGVLFGNLFTSITDREFLERIADVGVTLLLFTLGLEFSLAHLKQSLKRVSTIAILQISVCILVFLLVFMWFGFGFLPSLYMAIAAGLSSTAIVVKVLSEKGELESVPGELATAWLIVQDLTVVPIMILLPVVTTLIGSETLAVLPIVSTLGTTIGISALTLVFIWFLGKRGIPFLLAVAASSGSREIFLLSIIGIVFLSALTTYVIGLSAALGAFIAGVLISETSQNHAIFSEIRPLRDLFAVVFFVSLGMVLRIGEITAIVPMLLSIAAIVLVLKWGIIFVLARFIGSHRKTSFLTAIFLTQMSEFGFIIGREGLATGALTRADYVFIVALTFCTIMIGTSAMSHGHSLYYWFYKTIGMLLPKIFPIKPEALVKNDDLPMANHIVICGFGRVGRYIGRALDMTQIPYLVIDYNQSTVEELTKRGVRVLYGDPADKDILDYAQIEYARAVIVAIPDRHTQRMIITNAQTLQRHIKIICRTHHEEDQKWLKSLGVGVIVQPEFEAAVSIVERLLTQNGESTEAIAGTIHRLKIEHGLG